MRIKKFWEKTEIENLSVEDTSEVIDILQQSIENLDERKKNIFEVKNKLMNYQNTGIKKNDQIDDVVSNLEMCVKSIDDAMSKIDVSLKLMRDYSESGRKYLY